ncbi:hypothetical protein [Pseudaestuariivita rosea]|uniref:hypothetical protein n=1 Tax=Pseudaestuariivita rosea TaxID=2763263 RepID=UPI001ABAC496|nr:hypothetical protein [Pseudaestuariivita rosea]
MNNQKFWDAFSTFADSTWAFADDAWKALRWIIASVTVLLIYDQSQSMGALVLGLSLGLFSIISIGAKIIKFSFSGVTEKSLARGPLVSIAIATILFLVSVSFATMVWIIVAALYIQVIAAA